MPLRQWLSSLATATADAKARPQSLTPLSSPRPPHETQSQPLSEIEASSAAVGARRAGAAAASVLGQRSNCSRSRTRRRVLPRSRLARPAAPARHARRDAARRDGRFAMSRCHGRAASGAQHPGACSRRRAARGRSGEGPGLEAAPRPPPRVRPARRRAPHLRGGGRRRHARGARVSASAEAAAAPSGAVSAQREAVRGRADEPRRPAERRGRGARQAGSGAVPPGAGKSRVDRPRQSGVVRLRRSLLLGLCHPAPSGGVCECSRGSRGALGLGPSLQANATGAAPASAAPASRHACGTRWPASRPFANTAVRAPLGEPPCLRPGGSPPLHQRHALG
mmetsp:Transcript_25541/g.96229  ORF Transcript_25541/g.96229 Transcript_25541/m.96229 type:complete len:337 (-) Transcript_25541:1326-2336(-)